MIEIYHTPENLSTPFAKFFRDLAAIPPKEVSPVPVLRKAWIPCLWLALWQAAALLVGEELLLPAPLAVLGRMFSLLGEGLFWQSCLHSLGRVLLGFFLGVAAGTLLAVVSSLFPLAGEFLAPAMAAVKSTPVASFVILALVWIRAGGLSVFIAFLMVLPLTWQNVRQGIAGADRQLLEVARVYRFSLWGRLRGIYFPAARPYFLSALRTGLGFAWKAGIAGEVIAIAPGSIGLALYNSKAYLEMPDLFAWTGFIILLSMALERGMLFLLRERGDR